jgi:hypothetical protein
VGETLERVFRLAPGYEIGRDKEGLAQLAVRNLPRAAEVVAARPGRERDAQGYGREKKAEHWSDRFIQKSQSKENDDSRFIFRRIAKSWR